MKGLDNHDEMNKSFVIKKIKIEDKNLNSLINEGFGTADNYLKINPNLIIGKKIRGPRFNEDKNIIPYSIIGDPTHFEAYKKRNGGYNLKHFLTKGISTMNSTSTSHKKDNKRVYDYIEDEKIVQLYENINKEIQKNKKSSNDFLKEIPTNVKKQLQLQEKQLLSKNRSIHITNDISKNLARKIQKNPESLLINKVDEHRFKREFVDNVLNKSNNSYENRIPISHWTANLRHSQIDDLPQNSYIYYGNPYNPSWVPFKEKKVKSIDIIRNPLSKTKLDINKYIKSKKIFDSRLIETSNSTYINNCSSYSPNNNSKNLNWTDSLNNFNTNMVSNEMVVKIFFVD